MFRVWIEQGKLSFFFSVSGVHMCVSPLLHTGLEYFKTNMKKIVSSEAPFSCGQRVSVVTGKPVKQLFYGCSLFHNLKTKKHTWWTNNCYCMFLYLYKLGQSHLDLDREWVDEVFWDSVRVSRGVNTHRDELTLREEQSVKPALNTATEIKCKKY